MAYHPLKEVIEVADKAINEENFDALMEFYADDATTALGAQLNCIVPGSLPKNRQSVESAIGQQRSLIAKKPAARIGLIPAIMSTP